MGSETKKPRAATVEDCDEEDKVVRGTKQTASNKGKSRGERQNRTSTNEKSNRNAGYSSQTVTIGAEKSSSSKSSRVEVVKVQSTSMEKESRRKSTTGTAARSPTKSSRPGLTRSNVTSPPKLNTELPSRPKTDPSYFGVSPGTTYSPASSSSTRSGRPVSYYGGMPIPIPTSASSVSRPPVARSAFYVPPSTNMGVSYPQASPTPSYIGYAPTRVDPYYAPEPSRPNPLAERFARGIDPISRTTSAQGVRTLNDLSAFDVDLERRNIVRRRAREAEDMPPSPVPVRRQSITRVIDNRDTYDDDIRYESRPARAPYRAPSPAPRPPRRPSANRSSTFDYARDQPNYRMETSNQARRSSYYEGQRRSSDYEDKIREAAGYQEQVAGGPPVSLTAEALRKQQRTTASSRSTRSSGSRDESDFRRSATTRTTTSRFDADGENVTIKFKGDATINIAGAEIKCDDGAELNIVRSKGSIRNGSERGGSEYGMVPLDERRSRDHHRSSNYSRSTSKSGFSSPFPARAAYQQTPFF
jgi:hypothetical protein